jgi:hypothetical protein
VDESDVYEVKLNLKINIGGRVMKSRTKGRENIEKNKLKKGKREDNWKDK